MKIDYEHALNPAQLSAVLHERGPALVVAGAGSGKTRTLVYRVARLVETGVDPGAILLLTFTRRAAEEMLSRASLLLDGRCRSVEGGTFHSAANKFLRSFGPELGLASGFTILDRSDSEDIVSWIRKDLGLSRKDLRFPKKGALVDVFSRAVNVGVSLERLMETQFQHLAPFLEDMAEIQALYAEHKSKNGLLDYDDLLVYLHKLLETVEWVRLALHSRFRYVLVDEFQDTNPLQNEIVVLLAGAEENVMVVGDDSQSIYSFRGARFKNIIDFPKRFPSTRIVKLEENYRSTQSILDTANRIIAQARYKFTKCLFTRKEQGVRPTIWAVEDEHSQSVCVADEIQRLLEEGYHSEDIAVLFRGGHHSYDLEIELNRRGLDFVKHGGARFLEAAHVKDLLAHLRLVANPRDSFSWQRVLQLLEGVGLKRASRITEHVRNAGGGVEALVSFPKSGSTPGLANLNELLCSMAGVRGNPREQLELARAYYLPLLEKKYDDHPKRVRQLDDLLNLATRFTRLSDFLAEVTLDPPNRESSRWGVRNGLTLSTVHSAKGLEWRAVFVIWVAERWFPHSMVKEGSEEMEEERRLLYVAVTRAHDRLYLVYPRTFYKWGEGLISVHPSRFLSSVAGGTVQDAESGDRFRKPRSVLREPRAPREVSPLLGKEGGTHLTGKRIRHPTFGLGVVVACQGTDKIVVRFDDKGMTTLKLPYAPIEVLG